MAWQLGVPDLGGLSYLQVALNQSGINQRDRELAERARQADMQARQAVQREVMDAEYRRAVLGQQDREAARNAARAEAALMLDAEQMRNEAAEKAAQRELLGKSFDLGEGIRGIGVGPNSLQLVLPTAEPKAFTPEEQESLRRAGYIDVGGKVLPSRNELDATPRNQPIVDPISGETVGFYDQAGQRTVYPQRDQTAVGKQLTAEQTKRIGDLINVKAALPELIESYSKIADNWTTGPIAGAAAQAVGIGKNDPDIQTLEARLDQITPALARGVFGEVGVLTDADMKRYRALLPSRMHNREVAESLFKSLSSRVDDTIKSVIEATRDAGYDVSGFEKYLPTAAAAPEAESAAVETSKPKRVRQNGVVYTLQPDGTYR